MQSDKPHTIKLEKTGLSILVLHTGYTGSLPFGMCTCVCTKRDKKNSWSPIVDLAVSGINFVLQTQLKYREGSGWSLLIGVFVVRDTSKGDSLVRHLCMCSLGHCFILCCVGKKII